MNQSNHFNTNKPRLIMKLKMVSKKELTKLVLLGGEDNWELIKYLN